MTTRVAMLASLCATLSAAPALMPMPSRITWGTGELPIPPGFELSISGACDGRVTRAAARLKAQISKQTGTPISPNAGRPALYVECREAGKAVQTLDEDESYRLEITTTQAKITAGNPLGVLRGFATFAQLVKPGQPGFSVPVVSIDDRPRFPWRGLHLDVSRHWMPMDVVLRNLDGMWAVKLNVFHWHLSDNQGFRVESKRYPKLQEMGSDGQFYTQDQIRQVIAYARDRGIRVLPEFDVPGHSTAMLAGYPELGAAPGPFEVGRVWGIFDPVIDPTRDSVYQFLDGFIGEMAGLFPDEYFHIGGDEVNGREWNTNADIAGFKRAHGMVTAANPTKKEQQEANDKLQAYFNKQLLPIVTKHGKKMMGWDEILQPDLPKNIVIQSWRGQKSLADAVAQGFQGVLSSGYYLDHMESAGTMYLVDPEIDPATPQPRILGGEVCMWSEYVSAENVDSRIWPRSAAIAERFWSPAGMRDVAGMYARLGAIDRELDWLGLTQNSAYRTMLERLAGGGPVGPVKALADVAWPADLGGRARARRYTQQTPLNRLVDTARPDSPVAREFGRNVDAKAYGAVRLQLMEWRDGGKSLDLMIHDSTLLSELGPLARDLTAMGTMGLEALGYVESQRSAPAVWVKEKKAALAEMKKMRAEVKLTVAGAVENLVNAAAR